MTFFCLFSLFFPWSELLLLFISRCCGRAVCFDFFFQLTIDISDVLEILSCRLLFMDFCHGVISPGARLVCGFVP